MSNPFMFQDTEAKKNPSVFFKLQKERTNNGFICHKSQDSIPFVLSCVFRLTKMGSWQTLGGCVFGHISHVTFGRTCRHQSDITKVQYRHYLQCYQFENSESASKMVLFKIHLHYDGTTTAQAVILSIFLMFVRRKCALKMFRI